jgi:hypothetical protein
MENKQQMQFRVLYTLGVFRETGDLSQGRYKDPEALAHTAPSTLSDFAPDSKAPPAVPRPPLLPQESPHP